jgi:hypothetical protein
MEGVPMFGIFTVQLVLALVTLSLLARWYVAPRLSGLPLESALQPLLAVHTMRYIGLVFLAPTVVHPGLTQAFAIPAGLGTAIAGVLALASIAALRARSSVAIPLVWIFSVEGLGDFANAFYQAGAHGANVVSNLGAAYYVPIVIVPAALVTHVMILGLLIQRLRSRARPA